MAYALMFINASRDGMQRLAIALVQATSSAAVRPLVPMHRVMARSYRFQIPIFDRSHLTIAVRME